jgi:hypothetical protein
MYKILNTVHQEEHKRTMCVVLRVLDGRTGEHARGLCQDSNIVVFRAAAPGGDAESRPASMDPAHAISQEMLYNTLEDSVGQRSRLQHRIDFIKLLDFDFSSLFRVHDAVGPGTYGNPLHFAKKHNLWLRNVRLLKDGRVLFVGQPPRAHPAGAGAPLADAKMVIKQQFPLQCNV